MKTEMTEEIAKEISMIRIMMTELVGQASNPFGSPEFAEYLNLGYRPKGITNHDACSWLLNGL